MAKKNIGIARPILTRRCEKCGRFWTACHPKDDRVLCDYCREDTDGRVDKRNGEHDS